MDVKHSIYNYLLQKKKAISISDIATFFDVDSFLVEQTIDELVAELKVKPFKNKYMATNYITGTLVVSGERGYIENNNRKIWIRDRKSTRLNSSHQIISYAVFCL